MGHLRDSPYATRPNRSQSTRAQTGSGHIRSRGYLLRPIRSEGLDLQTRKGRIRNTAVHNTAQPEPKPENSNGVGPHSVTRVPSAAQPPPRPRALTGEGPPPGRCRTRHGPTETKARELKRGRAAFGTLPYTTRPSWNQSTRAQTAMGRIRSRGYLLRPSRSEGLGLQTRKGHLQNTAIHNTAQPEPKSESSNGVGPHLGARARGSCYATQAPVSTSRVENSPMVEMTSSAVRA